MWRIRPRSVGREAVERKGSGSKRRGGNRRFFYCTAGIEKAVEWLISLLNHSTMQPVNGHLGSVGYLAAVHSDQPPFKKYALVNPRIFMIRAKLALVPLSGQSQ